MAPVTRTWHAADDGVAPTSFVLGRVGGPKVPPTVSAGAVEVPDAERDARAAADARRPAEALGAEA